LAHYNLPSIRERKNFDLEGFINQIRLLQGLSRYENHFFVDDVIKDYDEALTIERMGAYNKVLIFKDYKKKNAPSYVKAFS
jgi:hypothetical protein